MDLAGPGQRADPSACGLQPSEDRKRNWVGSPTNQLLLRNAEKPPPWPVVSGFPGFPGQLPGHPHPHCWFDSPGEGGGVWRRAAPPASSLHFQEQGRGPCSGPGHKGRGGWAFPASKAGPFSSPGLGWNYTSGSRLGSSSGQSGRRAVTPAPSPGGPPGSQHISQAPESPGPGAQLGEAAIMCLPPRSGGGGKSPCEKPREGPSARSVARSGE